jgi:ParB family chromosome partitioning protein
MRFWLAYCMMSRPVDDVEDARRQQVGDELDENEDRGRGLLGGLQHDAIACRERRSELPDRHQDREVPRDDLADDAERLMEVIGDGVVVEFGERPLLRADRAGEVAEMVDRERDVGIGRLADRLAVVPGLGEGEKIEILLEPVGDLVEDQRAGGDRGAPPGGLGGMGGVERQLDILLLRARDLGDLLAVDRRGVVEIAAAERGDPLAADEILIARLERGGGLGAKELGLVHGFLPW